MITVTVRMKLRVMHAIRAKTRSMPFCLYDPSIFYNNSFRNPINLMPQTLGSGAVYVSIVSRCSLLSQAASVSGHDE